MNYPFTKEEVEKLPKARWTPETTAKTQAVVDRLRAARNAVILVNGHNNGVVYAMNRALKRFSVLDPAVKGTTEP